MKLPDVAQDAERCWKCIPYRVKTSDHSASFMRDQGTHTHIL